jgi:transmembrane sensor
MKTPYPSNDETTPSRMSAIEEAAAGWSERLRDMDVDAETQHAFDAWYAADRTHALAYERMEAARRRIAAVADTPELLALRNETLARVAGPRKRWSRYFVALAASMVAGIAALTMLGNETVGHLPTSIYEGVRAVVGGESVYQTAIGERLVATLADGSVITLNTDSRARVSYRDDVRNVKLEKGQGLFEVAKDASRPFIVAAGDRRVTALGTAFDIRLTDQMFEVTLIEGRVSVDTQPPGSVGGQSVAAAALQRTELVPGQQLIAAAAKKPIVRVMDVKRVVSWRNGQVIFENDALGQVIEEMNRYTRSQIVLEDKQLSVLRVSGAFDTGQTSVFVDALTQYFPIVVKEKSADRIVLAWRE